MMTASASRAKCHAGGGPGSSEGLGLTGLWPERCDFDRRFCGGEYVVATVLREYGDGALLRPLKSEGVLELDGGSVHQAYTHAFERKGYVLGRRRAKDLLRNTSTLRELGCPCLLGCPSRRNDWE